MRRAIPGGPAQGRPETLGGHRKLWHPAGHRLRGRQPPRLPAAGPTLQTAASQLGGLLPDHRACHLDAGYDSQPTRQALDEQGFTAQIAHKGTPAPVQATRRWPVGRTHSWMNGYGKLSRITDRDAAIVRFYLYLAAAFVTMRALIQRARHRYRWDTRPTTKWLK
jgi:hypothetical protein